MYTGLRQFESVNYVLGQDLNGLRLDKEVNLINCTRQTNKSLPQTFNDKSVGTSCQREKKFEKKNYNFFAFKVKNGHITAFSFFCRSKKNISDPSPQFRTYFQSILSMTAMGFYLLESFCIEVILLGQWRCRLLKPVLN